jgi:hypothetical protein
MLTGEASKHAPCCFLSMWPMACSAALMVAALGVLVKTIANVVMRALSFASQLKPPGAMIVSTMNLLPCASTLNLLQSTPTWRSGFFLACAREERSGARTKGGRT